MAGQVKPIPVPVILAAVNGDEDALAAVVAHYQKYIRALATRPLKDEYGNDRLLSLVHKMFTNTYPAFCRGNVRCKVKGGLEQQRARFYRGARFRISLILSHRNLVGECLPQTLLYAA